MFATLSTQKGPGGVQSIQIRLFEYFSYKGIPCKLFDTIDGHVYNELNKKKINFTFIEIDKIKSKKDYSQHLQDDDLLILFNGTFFECSLLFQYSKCKILFWEVFSPWLERFVYSRYFPIKFLANNQQKKILSILAKNEAIYFIEAEGKSIVEKLLNIRVSEDKYLPIPIQINDQQKLNKLNDILKITYVGRADDWKIYPILKVLTDINADNLTDKLKINIVTDDIIYFKEKIERSIQNFISYDISFFESLSIDELDNILLDSNLNIGMGTAALEGAKLGIPTILIDASNEEFPEDYKYKWIFELKDRMYIEMIDEDTKKYGGKWSMSEIFKEIKINYTALSNKSYKYVLNNNSIEIIANQIENYGKEAKLTLSSFSDLSVIKVNRLLRNLGIK